MASITRHALRVYAALGALKGGGGDVLDALIPFFEPILQVMHDRIFDPHLVAVGVKKLYHWRFTPEVAEQFIPRLVKRGVLQRVGVGTTAVYRVNFPAQALPSQNDNINATLEKLIDEFEKFPALLSDILNYSKSRDELADILIRFLVSSTVFGEANGGAQATPNESNLLADLEEGGRPLNDDDRYIAARFVRHIADNKPEYLPHLARLSSIGLLTEVVDDFIRPIGAAEQAALTIVLDAPLALDYLGLSGRAIQQDIRSVLDSLRKIGCQIVVFPVTCSEMSRNLTSMLSLPANRRHGYTHQAMANNEVLEAYVRAVAAKPEDALEQVGIQVRPMKLDQYPNLHKYFTTEQYDDFFTRVFWAADVTPRDHDATCMALLMRLREGQHKSDIFKCRFVFATRNATFARVSRDYLIEGNLLAENQEGPVVHQRELATIAWLRTGLSSEEAIPRGQLVASCERVLQVRPEVTEAIRAKLKEYEPEKGAQFELLLQDQRSIRKMADATLNDERVVTSENAQHLLELMKEAAFKDAKVGFEKQLEEAKKKHNETQKRTRKKYEDKEKEADELSKRLFELERAEAESNSRTGGVVRRMLDHVNGRVRLVKNAITGLVLLIAGTAMLNSFIQYKAESPVWVYFLVLLNVIGLYQLVADFLHWPQFGIRHLLNLLARILLHREVERRGVDWVSERDFVIEGGRVTSVVAEIDLPAAAYVPD